MSKDLSDFELIRTVFSTLSSGSFSGEIEDLPESLKASLRQATGRNIFDVKELVAWARSSVNVTKVEKENIVFLLRVFEARAKYENPRG